MQCRIDGCDRDSRYKEAQLCQKHYFRLRRFGTTDTVRWGHAKPRYENPAGYQMVYVPSHPLSKKGGYVAEHRAVLYAAIGPGPMNCELCGVGLTWATCQVDHIDNDVRNNQRENLRPTCRTCNTRRGMRNPVEWSRTSKIEYDGVCLTSHEWARDPRVKVKSATIRARLAAGMTVEQALFGPKKTHNGRKPMLKGATKRPHMHIDFAGRSLTASQWAREPGVSVSDVTIRKRIRAGWFVGMAIFNPPADIGAAGRQSKGARA